MINKIAYLFVRLSYNYYRSKFVTAGIKKYHYGKKLNNLSVVLSIWDKEVRYVKFGPFENTKELWTNYDQDVH